MNQQCKDYGFFLFFIYLNNNNKIIKNNNILELNNKQINNCLLYFELEDEFQEEHQLETKNKNISFNLFKRLDYTITIDNFPWASYLYLNKDLIKNGLESSEESWNHWVTHGIKEERTYTYLNNSSLHQGRLGNIFFVNMFLHFMSIKYNLKCYYKHSKVFNELGIYYNKGKKVYKTNCLITDHNFIHMLKYKNLPPSNLIIKDVWFQTKEFCNILKCHFKRDIIKNKIIDKNIYKYRYDNNNDLFVHLRLGDVSQITKQQIKYYELLLSEINYNKGYISSDSIKDPFCIELILKYNLNIIDYDEAETIMFASTCNNLILSGGTFSWLIGFLAFYSKKIYYPDIENKWYGDIFSFSNWIKK